MLLPGEGSVPVNVNHSFARGDTAEATKSLVRFSLLRDHGKSGVRDMRGCSVIHNSFDFLFCISGLCSTVAGSAARLASPEEFSGYSLSERHPYQSEAGIYTYHS